MIAHRFARSWRVALVCGVLAMAQAQVQAQTPQATPDAGAAAGVHLGRHALIIGVGRYANPDIAPLPGVVHDRDSATQMARAMEIADSNIRYLQDEQATGDAIRQALRDLTDRVADGDKVFIHYSGHGTRYLDASAGGCVEALLAHDGGASGTLSNHEMAQLLTGITRKTDKLFVMYDACHSGGVVDSAPVVRTRSLSGEGDALRPKAAGISDACARPSNMRTRSLVGAAQDTGALPQDIIHVSASRANEISFDDANKGGLATQYMRDCMLRDAQDLDKSGGISIEEIRVCAQAKLDKRLENDSFFAAHHLVINGNADFVPSWFGHVETPTAPAVQAPVQTAPLAAITPVVPAPSVAAEVPVASTPVARSEQALRQVFDQRDAKRTVEVRSTDKPMKIGVDYLQFSVTAKRAGYVYVVSAATDSDSVYVLFPNALDSNNRIEAGASLSLPRAAWRIKAAGPAGKNHLLVVVSDAPKDLASLKATTVGPFMASLNDAQGRAALGALMTSARKDVLAQCQRLAARSSNPLCSEAYGAALFTVEEAP